MTCDHPGCDAAARRETAGPAGVRFWCDAHAPAGAGPLPPPPGAADE